MVSKGFLAFAERNMQKLQISCRPWISVVFEGKQK
jgi:hypothetical protein